MARLLFFAAVLLILPLVVDVSTGPFLVHLPTALKSNNGTVFVLEKDKIHLDAHRGRMKDLADTIPSWDYISSSLTVCVHFPARGKQYCNPLQQFPFSFSFSDSRLKSWEHLEFTFYAAKEEDAHIINQRMSKLDSESRRTLGQAQLNLTLCFVSLEGDGSFHGLYSSIFPNSLLLEQNGMAHDFQLSSINDLIRRTPSLLTFYAEQHPEVLVVGRETDDAFAFAAMSLFLGAEAVELICVDAQQDRPGLCTDYFSVCSPGKPCPLGSAFTVESLLWPPEPPADKTEDQLHYSVYNSIESLASPHFDVVIIFDDLFGEYALWKASQMVMFISPASSHGACNEEQEEGICSIAPSEKSQQHSSSQRRSEIVAQQDLRKHAELQLHDMNELYTLEVYSTLSVHLQEVLDLKLIGHEKAQLTRAGNTPPMAWGISTEEELDQEAGYSPMAQVMGETLSAFTNKAAKKYDGQTYPHSMIEFSLRQGANYALAHGTCLDLAPPGGGGRRDEGGRGGVPPLGVALFPELSPYDDGFTYAPQIMQMIAESGAYGFAYGWRWLEDEGQLPPAEDFLPWQGVVVAQPAWPRHVAHWAEALLPLWHACLHPRVYPWARTATRLLLPGVWARGELPWNKAFLRLLRQALARHSCPMPKVYYAEDVARLLRLPPRGRRPSPGPGPGGPAEEEEEDNDDETARRGGKEEQEEGRRRLCFRGPVALLGLAASEFGLHGGPREGALFRAAARAHLRLPAPAPPAGGMNAQVRAVLVERDGAERRLLNTGPTLAAVLRTRLFDEGFLLGHRGDLGALGFREQVALMQQADVVIATHGAALAVAALFLEPPSALVDLLPSRAAELVWAPAAEGLGHLYLPLLPPEEDAPPPAAAANASASSPPSGGGGGGGGGGACRPFPPDCLGLTPYGATALRCIGLRNCDFAADVLHLDTLLRQAANVVRLEKRPRLLLEASAAAAATTPGGGGGEGGWRTPSFCPWQRGRLTDDRVEPLLPPNHDGH